MRQAGVISVVLALLVVGCNKKDESKSSRPDSIGVDACDEYVAKWEACFKDPKARAVAEPGFKQLRDGWKTLAGQGEIAKQQLEKTCKAQIEALANNPACK